MKKAIVLLSGGIDSAVCMGIAKDWGFDMIHALSFDYGQHHIIELQAAAEMAKHYNVIEHKIIVIPQLAPITNEQPYVPARNTIFLSFALGYAELNEIEELFIGMNADDSYFPDCRSPFFHAFNSLASVAVKKRVHLNAPLLYLNKAKIIKKGIELNVPLEKTITCYDGNNCGVCPACKTRLKGFEELGLKDPLIYAA